MFRNLVLFLFAFFLLLAGGCGCSPGMRAFNINVELDSKLANQTVFVDLVGVNPANERKWDGKDMVAYFNPNDPEKFRADHIEHQLIHRIEFTAGSGNLKATLQATDDVWSKWKTGGAMSLYVITDLASRSYIEKITLNTCLWPSEVRQLDISIRDSGIYPRQAPLPVPR